MRTYCIHKRHIVNYHLFYFVQYGKERKDIPSYCYPTSHLHLLILTTNNCLFTREINGPHYQYLHGNARPINIEIRVWNLLNKCYMPVNCFLKAMRPSNDYLKCFPIEDIEKSFCLCKYVSVVSDKWGIIFLEHFEMTFQWIFTTIWHY